MCLILEGLFALFSQARGRVDTVWRLALERGFGTRAGLALISRCSRPICLRVLFLHVRNAFRYLSEVGIQVLSCFECFVIFYGLQKGRVPEKRFVAAN